MPHITRIVLTGGPCAGKTTALATLVRELEAAGYVTAVVPEIPTILFANGFSARTAKDDWERKIYVWQMCLVQVALEAAQLAGLELACNRENKPGVLLCDRGVTDNRAYVSAEVWAAVCNICCYNDHGFRRYDAVVHMVSAAVGAAAYYRQNAVRTETVEKAAALDAKTLAAWQGHPHIQVVDNSTGFGGKIDRVVAAVKRAVAVKQKPAEKPAQKAEVHLCGFDEAWIGHCKVAVAAAGEYCGKHSQEKCRCGLQATGNCDATIGPMVCGIPTCGRCTHSH